MPLKIPRLAKVAVVTGLAIAPVAVLGAPAHAGAVRDRQWWLDALQVRQAWRVTEGSGVTVAVLADGVNPGQPDITGAVTAGPDFTRSGRVFGGPHVGVLGTALASVIAGHGHGRNGSMGMLGIAPASRVLSIRVTLSPGDPLWSDRAVTAGLPAAIASGIRYAVGRGAAVIDLPADPGLPRGNDARGVAPAGGSAAERAAVAYAVSRGVILVAPAGDNARQGDAPAYPAAYRGVIAVGAVGPALNMAPYSNRRADVSITAAGDSVIAAAPRGYQVMHSTWAASAIVSGMAALVKSQFPSMTPAQVARAIDSGAEHRRQAGARQGRGLAIADARLALARAATIAPPRAMPAASGARPRTEPMPPPARSGASLIVMGLLRDAGISLAVLAALLGLIAAYAKTTGRYHRRRRAGSAALSASQFPGLPGLRHARQPGPRPAISPRFEPVGATAGRARRQASDPAARSVPAAAILAGRQAQASAAIAGRRAALARRSAPRGRSDPPDVLTGRPASAAPITSPPAHLQAAGFDPSAWIAAPAGGARPPSGTPARHVPMAAQASAPGWAAAFASRPVADLPAQARPAPLRAPGSRGMPGPPAPGPAGRVVPLSAGTTGKVVPAPAGTAGRPGGITAPDSRPQTAEPAVTRAGHAMGARARHAAGQPDTQVERKSPARADARRGLGTGPRPVVPRGSGTVAGADRPTVRHVRVSGSPPWEPAPRPTSDLPWRSPAVPPASEGQAGPSVPGAGGRPIYVWNPAGPAQGGQPAAPGR